SLYPLSLHDARSDLLGQVMRFPVMALLWVSVIAVCYMAGSCMMESLARRRARRAFDLKAWLRDNAVFDAQARLDGLPPVLRNLVDRKSTRLNSSHVK